MNIKVVQILLLNLLSISKIMASDSSGFWPYDKKYYALIYTNPDRTPFSYLTVEDKYFKERNCRYQNCNFSKNLTNIDDIKLYDAVLFHVADLPHIKLPEERADTQKYIFVSDVPPTVYGVHSDYDDVFNFTWTYKLNSDVTLRNLIVKTKQDNEVIGPAKDLEGTDGPARWIDIATYSKPINDEIKTKLQNKTKAAAWFASDCNTSSKREEYVKKLNEELKHYNKNIDIYGKCGNLTCPHDNVKECHALLQSDYYFYLAFESSMSEDYVTEELLIPLKNFAVPVVYGGANYDRFMPKGIYIDANTQQPKELAKMMNYYITNKENYYDFFKWHDVYSYHYTNESADTDEICEFCAFLNDHKHFYKTTVYTYIDKFWSS